jgi:hypothetical protein
MNAKFKKNYVRLNRTVLINLVFIYFFTFIQQMSVWKKRVFI